MAVKTTNDKIEYGNLYLFPRISKRKIKQLYTYSLSVDEMFDTEVQSQENALYAEANDLHPDYVESVQGEIDEIDKDFRFLNRRMAFIKAYLTFEDLLNWFCKLSQPLTNVSYDNKGVRKSSIWNRYKFIREGKRIVRCIIQKQGSDRGIMKARKYIMEQLNIEQFPNAAWQNISSYNNIVNVLKHMDGDFGDEDNSQVRKAVSFIKSHNALCKLSKYGDELELEIDFIKTATADMILIIEHIETQMREKYPECFNWKW